LGSWLGRVVKWPRNSQHMTDYIKA